VLHNASFDLGFLARLGFSPSAPVRDTVLMSRVLYAGLREGHKLEDCARRELSIDLDKSQQGSDWSGPLTGAQLAYAARDVEVRAPLSAALAGKLAEAGLTAVVALEERCLPAVAWLARSGVAVDRDAWLALVRCNRERAAVLRDQMLSQAPVRPGEMYPAWNW